MHKITAEFDVPKDYLYMNSGSVSMAPRCVRDRVKELQDEAEYNPTAALFNSWKNLWEAQTELAKFLNADPKDLFLRNNISEAMNNFILGLPLGKNDEILYADMEYGAVKNTCRFRAERDGLPLREFRAPRTEQNAAQIVIDALKPNTKMLALSHVFTANGLILPIEEIAEETRKRGIYFVVDGAHAVGALPLDFSKLSNVDCYGGNLHKWLMSAKGTAFGWVHPMHQEKIVPLQAGWTTFDFLPEHRAFGAGSRFQGKFISPGTIDYSSFLAIPRILEFWRTWGAAEIRGRLKALQLQFQNEIQEKLPHLELVSPAGDTHRGPLLAYRLPPKWKGKEFELFGFLYEKERLQIALPFLDDSRCLRLTPHVYNTEDEVSRTTDILTRHL